ncbi:MULTISPECIES: serine protease [Nostocales]|uniref:Tetratricopeptide repeat protein n=3 Tax=Nostocales TaxID=1161 RepID=A0A8S9T6G9_9CYAN|nr:serine protease [Tolypothrix bouteillei]KAF3887995.1 tetratricopeptide repeat protein [Tolypothrix bouteillei VB521301]
MGYEQINHRFLAFSIWISALLMLSVQGCYLNIYTPAAFALQQSSKLSSEQLQKLAQAITVGIVSGERGGSGIILQKEGDLYTVLTSQHVVDVGKAHVIYTNDGQSYRAELVKGIDYNHQDLVLLQFRANKQYIVAPIGNSLTLKEGDEVFSAGFPFESNSFVAKQLVFRMGRVSLLLGRPLKGGYRVGYTNEVDKGMSGGPMLDSAGKVIGINGIHAQPLWGDPYVYEDGSQPNDALRDRMRKSSWGVPIETLARLEPPIIPPEVLQAQPLAAREITKPIPPAASLVDNIAKEITVQIAWENSHGSGVIAAKEGNKYYVLTAGHVVRGRNELKVVTHDGKQYSVDTTTVKTWPGTDLALLQFISNNTYQVGVLGNYDLGNEDRVVFVSGTPVSSQSAEPPTRQFNAGLLYGGGIDRVKDARSFAFGYDLVYTNSTAKGMSGSPVLDSLGRVIGIHTAAEGEPTLIKQKTGEEREIQLGYSLGVPIRTFLALVQQDKKQIYFKIQTSLPPRLSAPQLDEIITSAFNIEPPGTVADEFDWLSYGNKLLRLQKYEKAADAFDKAIRTKPNFYQAWYAKGRAQRLQRKYKEALVSFNQATSYNSTYDPAWRELGDTLFALNRYEEARQALEKVVELKPDEFMAYRGLCSVLAELGNYAQAIKACDRAIKINPQPLQYILRGEIHRNMGDTQEAIKDFDTALNLQPDNPFAYRQQGVARSQEGNYQGALADLNKAISLQSDNAYAYVERGVVYAQMGNRLAFVEDFNKALHLEPDSASIYSKRGLARYYLQDFKGAIEDYTTAIGFAPESAYIYYKKLGDVRTAQKDFAAAGENYTEAIRLQPNYTPAYVGRGIVRARVGNQQGMLEDFNQALSQQPDNAWLYSYRGDARFIVKDFQGGMEDYQKAIAMFPQLGYLYYTLRGNARQEQKDYKGAIADYNEALRLKPNFALAYNNRGLARVAWDEKDAISSVPSGLYINPKEPVETNKDYERAINDFTEAIHHKPDFALAYNNRGFARYIQKDYEGALADYNQAIRLHPKNALLYISRAFVRYARKDDKGAIEDFNQAVRLKPELVEAYKNQGFARPLQKN